MLCVSWASRCVGWWRCVDGLFLWILRLGEESGLVKGLCVCESVCSLREDVNVGRGEVCSLWVLVIGCVCILRHVW